MKKLLLVLAMCCCMNVAAQEVKPNRNYLSVTKQPAIDHAYGEASYEFWKLYILHQGIDSPAIKKYIVETMEMLTPIIAMESLSIGDMILILYKVGKRQVKIEKSIVNHLKL